VRERLKLTEELSRYEQQAQKMRSERDSANLSGQVEAMQAQVSELMRVLDGWCRAGVRYAKKTGNYGTTLSR